MARELTENDRHRCVVLARFRVINSTTKNVIPKNYEIEIDPDGWLPRDVRDKYKDPVITDGSPIEVRVYDEAAVDLDNPPTFEGDCCARFGRGPLSR